MLIFFFFCVVLLFLPGPIDLLICECGFYGIILSAFQLIKYVNYHAFVFLTGCIGLAVNLLLKIHVAIYFTVRLPAVIG